MGTFLLSSKHSHSIKLTSSLDMGIHMVLFVALVAVASATVLPPGVTLLGCPRYPVCDVLINPATGKNQVNPLDFPNYTPLNNRYPAGLMVQACPNYPFCDTSINPRTGYQYV